MIRPKTIIFQALSFGELVPSPHKRSKHMHTDQTQSTLFNSIPFFLKQKKKKKEKKKKKKVHEIANNVDSDDHGQVVQN